MSDRQPLVLVADDEPYMVTLLRRLFEQDGYRVADVSDGNSALREAESLMPELILIDVQMPGINGFEVLRQLRQNEKTHRIPAIFITAAAREPSDVARGLGLGADDYVFKPFNPNELLARARSKIRARQLEEHLERRKLELEALVRIGREFNQRLKLDELLDLVMSVCAKEIPAEKGFVCLFDQRTHVNALRVLNGNEFTPESVQELIERKDSVIRQILKTQRTILLHDDDLGPMQDFHSLIGTRIEHHDAILGLIVLGSPGGGRYDANHTRLLESIASQAALAIRNAELYADLRYYALNLESMVSERSAELRAAQSQLLRSEKLASLGRLAAGIAHEVNNPLQAIRNCLELAIEDIEADRLVDKELLTVAEQDVQRIRRIVRQLLDFSRPGSGRLVSVKLGELVANILRLVEPQLSRAHVRVSQKIAHVPSVFLDEDQFKQVILNLILNAQEAMPEGGKLDVVVAQQGEDIIISFTDTGIGIPEGDLPKIFDPFFSTKTDGTGLGLAVSYGIIEGHGGRIEVNSTPNKGSTFTVVMPYSD